MHNYICHICVSIVNTILIFVRIIKTKYQTNVRLCMLFSTTQTYIYTQSTCQKRHTDAKVIHNQTTKTCAISTTQPVKTIQTAQNHAKITLQHCKVIHIHIVILHKTKYHTKITIFRLDCFRSDLFRIFSSNDSISNFFRYALIYHRIF